MKQVGLFPTYPLTHLPTHPPAFARNGLALHLPTPYIHLDFGRAENRSRPAHALDRGRKVRTPKGAMPRNLLLTQAGYTGGGMPWGVPTERATTNTPPRPFQS